MLILSMEELYAWANQNFETNTKLVDIEQMQIALQGQLQLETIGPQYDKLKHICQLSKCYIFLLDHNNQHVVQANLCLPNNQRISYEIFIINEKVEQHSLVISPNSFADTNAVPNLRNLLDTLGLFDVSVGEFMEFLTNLFFKCENYCS